MACVNYPIQVVGTEGKFVVQLTNYCIFAARHGGASTLIGSLHTIESDYHVRLMKRVHVYKCVS